MTMPLYTFIMEYAGGTYISQVKAASPKAAIVRWARELPAGEIDDFGPASKVRLIREVSEEPPVAVLNLSNAWCVSTLIRGKLALMNIVRTADA
jgi:hypothetical protein